MTVQVPEQAWSATYRELSAADHREPLDPENLERCAIAAHLIGRQDESATLFSRAHQAFLARGDAESAARCAFELGFQLMLAGEAARGSGWLTRARRVLDEAGRDSVQYGYLAIPEGVSRMFAGDARTANEAFDRVIEAGLRFGDAELVTLGRYGRGHAWIGLGKVAEGFALLDEVMIAITAGEIPPLHVGSIYCSVIGVCQSVFDLRRAGEWTEALARWCASHPDIVPYRGHCLVHHAEVMQVNGDWSAAMDELLRAQALVEEPAHRSAAGAAHYRRGELHRLRGELAQAEDAFRAALDAGRQPHPGLALLRLAQGRTDDAGAAIRRLLAERQDRPTRARILIAAVEILLAMRDVNAARNAAIELAEISASLDAPYLQAAAAQASGAVLLAEGEAARALAELRRAWASWRAVGAPYEAACTRLAIASAHRALGDEDTAVMELNAARRALEELGAVTDIRRADELSRPAAGPASGLTEREVEVIALVARGETNRAIATQLGISEKTVARHVANIFFKLSLPNRAAATAYAYQHGLV